MSHEAHEERKWFETPGTKLPPPYLSSHLVLLDKIVRDPVEYEARRIAPQNLGPCSSLYVPYLDCIRTKSDSEYYSECIRTNNKNPA